MTKEKMDKFKGYDVLGSYPEDGWLKGYFYVADDDLKSGRAKTNLAYRDLGFIRHKDYMLHLLNIKRDEQVLDVGCADGAMMVYCGLLGARVWGVDIALEAVQQANQYLDKFKIEGEAIQADARELKFSENHFDKVISADFFEHLSYKDKVSVLQEIKRVLKPGGRAVIKTPNLRYLRLAKLFKQIGRVLKLKNPLDVVIAHTTGKDLQHIGLTTKTELSNAIKAAGFMNFKFHYELNSKIEKVPQSMAELCVSLPLLKDIFSEVLVVEIHKPIILSFFP
ncbi:MAG: class I SAM-dependent methyltransferase [Planctomycetes bacterium]|nr:class I SAM-dependent methyltransferase [Planctomycetota bacterium]